MGLIFIYVLHVNFVVLRMGADKLHPDNPGPVLNFHHEAVLVAGDVENAPMVTRA